MAVGHSSNWTRASVGRRGDGFWRVAWRPQRPVAKTAGKAGQLRQRSWVLYWRGSGESSALPGWQDWCGKDEVRHKYVTFPDFLSPGHQLAMRPAIFLTSAGTLVDPFPYSCGNTLRKLEPEGF